MKAGVLSIPYPSNTVIGCKLSDTLTAVNTTNANV